MPASRDALGSVNFHCSPAAAVNADGSYTVGAVTATASFRFAKWLEGWFKLSGCNIIIGKGGMTSEIYRQHFVPQPGDLSHHRRLRHRRAARPRHQARRRRLLARRARPRPGGVGARCRELRPVPGRKRPRRRSLFERENAKIDAGLDKLYEGMRPPSMRRLGDADDKTQEVI